MSSEKVHYLKPEKTSEGYNSLIQNLEKRLDRIEGEFRSTLSRIEKKQKPSSKTTAELASLVKSLEGKIQTITEELRSQQSKKNASHEKQTLDFFDSISELIHLDAFKELLHSLWSSPPQENYDVDEFGMDPYFIEKVKPLFNFLYESYWRVSVKGLKNIPGTGKGLIVANHSGTLPYDGSMIAAAVVNEHPSRRDVRFLVEDFVYHFPFLGTFMYRIGGVRACPENAERLLDNNHLVTVFPEGVKGIGKHYKNRYRLQRFGRGGFIKLALKTNAPLIPTAVIGAEEIHPLLYKSTLLARPFGIPYIPVTPTLPLLGPLGLIPLPSKWTIVFGEPIHFSPQYSAKDAEDQLLVNKLAEMVRQKIQEMIMEELKNRRSVWFG